MNLRAGNPESEPGRAQVFSCQDQAGVIVCADACNSSNLRAHRRRRITPAGSGVPQDRLQRRHPSMDALGLLEPAEAGRLALFRRHLLTQTWNPHLDLVEHALGVALDLIRSAY